MFFVKPLFFLKWMYPQVIWNMPRREKNIYLTFDDGPIPSITPWVLQTLAQHDAKATFFCVGENIVKHPEIFDQIKTQGHQVGNHTFNHLRGWDQSDEAYLQNILACQKLTQTDLFRPPYLRAKRSQLKRLKDKYRIIFFDILSYDYESSISSEQCVKNVIKNAKNGSIVVFHDNTKAFKHLQYTLPKILTTLRKKGFSFKTL